MNAVTVHDAHKQVDQPKTVLLDVREPDEWIHGHAERAVHLPMSALSEGEFDPDSSYLVVCRSGARSAQVTMALANAGYSAANVHGGMNAWAQAGLPMASETNNPPRVVS